MKHILAALIAIMLLNTATQAQYIQQGKITYERKVNDHSIIDDFARDRDGEGNGSEWIEQLKKQFPKFRIDSFDLSFNTERSIYVPKRKEEDEARNPFLTGPASQNTVLTDFTTKHVTASKNIFEKNFMVQDTIRQMKWKIMSEIRTIGDYKCRKAVGKIYDSVVVVAFYTDDIMVSGGPEMMSGLPGMIMELAIPRMHATWIATKVELAPPAPSDMTVHGKGKKVTEDELAETLKRTFADWGKQTSRNLWWSLL